MPRFVALCVGVLLLGLGYTDSAQNPEEENRCSPQGIGEQRPADADHGLQRDRQAGRRSPRLRQDGPAGLRAILAKDSDAKVRQAALAALGKTEAETKDYVANMLKYLKEDKDFGVQTAALGQLSNYGQEAAIAINPLKERLAELREANKDQDPGNIRGNILNALAQINQGLNLPLAIETLKEDKAVSVKLNALGRIRQIGQQGGAKQTAPLLIETYQASLKEGPSPELRRSILDALAVIEPKPKRYLALLIETLKKDKDPAEIVAVIAALGRGGEEAKEAIPLVLEAQKGDCQRRTEGRQRSRWSS